MSSLAEGQETFPAEAGILISNETPHRHYLKDLCIIKFESFLRIFHSSTTSNEPTHFDIPLYKIRKVATPKVSISEQPNPEDLSIAGPSLALFLRPEEKPLDLDGRKTKVEKIVFKFSDDAALSALVLSLQSLVSLDEVMKTWKDGVVKNHLKSTSDSIQSLEAAGTMKVSGSQTYNLGSHDSASESEIEQEQIFQKAEGPNHFHRRKSKPKSRVPRDNDSEKEADETRPALELKSLDEHLETFETSQEDVVEESSKNLMDRGQPIRKRKAPGEISPPTKFGRLVAPQVTKRVQLSKTKETTSDQHIDMNHSPKESSIYSLPVSPIHRVNESSGVVNSKKGPKPVKNLLGTKSNEVSRAPNQKTGRKLRATKSKTKKMENRVKIARSNAAKECANSPLANVPSTTSPPLERPDQYEATQTPYNDTLTLNKSKSSNDNAVIKEKQDFHENNYQTKAVQTSPPLQPLTDMTKIESNNEPPSIKNTSRSGLKRFNATDKDSTSRKITKGSWATPPRKRYHVNPHGSPMLADQQDPELQPYSHHINSNHHTPSSWSHFSNQNEESMSIVGLGGHLGHFTATKSTRSTNSKAVPDSPTVESKAITSHASSREVEKAIMDGGRLHQLQSPFSGHVGSALTKISPFMLRLQESYNRASALARAEAGVNQEAEYCVPRTRAVTARRLASINTSSSDISRGGTEPDAREAYEREWERSLKPHQLGVLATMNRISRGFVRNLVSKESAIDDIIDEYYQDGLALVQTMDTAHTKQYQDIESESQELAMKKDKVVTKFIDRLESRQKVVENEIDLSMKKWIQETDNLGEQVTELKRDLSIT